MNAYYSWRDLLRIERKAYKARAWNFSFFVITDEVFNLPLSDAVWGALLAQIPKRGITGSACLL